MDIDLLNIEEKTNGVPSPATSGTAHKLTALEFNLLVAKVNELVAKTNKIAYLTQDEYDVLVESGNIIDDVEYNIIEND